MKAELPAALRAQLAQRIPYKLWLDQEGVLHFRWLYVGKTRFTHPFFEESVSRCLSFPENAQGQMPVTGWEEVLSAADDVDSAMVTALIFHASRCGSTLLAQMVNEDERCIVLAEVPLLDALLRLRIDHPLATDFPLEKLYHAVVRLLGRRVSDRENYLFIKMDSWHTMFYEHIRNMYPEIPFFLMCRNPLEIAKSHSKQPGMHAVPGVLQPSIFGLSKEAISSMTSSIYLAFVLAAYYRTYADILVADNNAHLLNYHDGPIQLLKKFYDGAGIQLPDEVAGKAEQRSRYHSKTPDQIFSGDTRAEVRVDDFNEALVQFTALTLPPRK